MVDWWGGNFDPNGKRIVRFNGKHWFVKFKPDPEERRRDYLAYLLGRNWANIAEVRPLSESEFAELQSADIALPDWASADNTFLVRLVQDYSLDQLPKVDLNSAVASELVFSLWIRRRDAHTANRGYIDGIPVFFDHQTAQIGRAHV